MADIIQIRRDTEANWTSANPILAQGEVAITLDDLDTEPKFKIGDGTNTWSALPYFTSGSDLPTGTTSGEVLIWNNSTSEWEVESKLNFNTDTNELVINGTWENKQAKIYLAGKNLQSDNGDADYNYIECTHDSESNSKFIVKADGQILSDYLTGTGNRPLLANSTGLIYAGVLSDLWQYFDEVRNTSTPNATIPAHQLVAKGTETNIDAIISPKGTGAILAQIPDGAVAGGNKRGIYAVDLQTKRSDKSNVASGEKATISGGEANTASNIGASVAGGVGNTASGEYGVSAGFSNTASGQYSGCLSGWLNTASNINSVIAGGRTNTASGLFSAILGGRWGVARFYGQQAQASDRFDSDGDAQRSSYVLNGDTLTTNYYRLYLDGSGSSSNPYIDLTLCGAYSTWQCKLKVTGLRRLTGAIDHYVSEHNFMIYRQNGVPVVADITEIHVYQQSGGSSVATGISISSNKYLAIDMATTETGWRFAAHLETVETFASSLI